MTAVRPHDDTQPIPIVRGRHAAPKPQRSRGRRALVVAREVGIVAVIVVALAVLVRLGLGQVAYVGDDAMMPTLSPGERVLVSPWGAVESGDVVLVRSPDAWNGSDGQAFVRVIAEEGQRVACCDGAGNITVDGDPLQEPYRAGATDQVEFEVVVPAGRIFVLADERTAARDSRVVLDVEQGTLSLDQVRGRAVAVLWPPRGLSG